MAAAVCLCGAWRFLASPPAVRDGELHHHAAGGARGQGAGAALIVPQILATLHITLKGTAHARAISLYGGIGGIAFIVGQMGGGWLVSADIAGLGWRNAFFINVPICLLVLAFSPRYVPETRREAHSRIDWQGTFSLALILCCLLFPMALGPELHWPWTLQLMLAAVLPLLVWMRASALSKQQRGEQPLLPPRLLKLTSIRFGMAIALLFFSAWSGFMFCMALTMQAGLGMAPWQSGNSFIALGVAYFISALYAPKLIARYSMGRILLTGLAVQIVGLLLLSATFIARYPHHHPGAGPSTALIGYGQALIVNSFTVSGCAISAPATPGPGARFSALCSRRRWVWARQFSVAILNPCPAQRRRLSAGADRFPGGGSGDDAGTGRHRAVATPSP
jgi:MFS family permease